MLFQTIFWKKWDNKVDNYNRKTKGKLNEVWDNGRPKTCGWAGRGLLVSVSLWWVNFAAWTWLNYH